MGRRKVGEVGDAWPWVDGAVSLSPGPGLCKGGVGIIAVHFVTWQLLKIAKSLLTIMLVLAGSLQGFGC